MNGCLAERGVESQHARQVGHSVLHRVSFPQLGAAGWLAGPSCALWLVLGTDTSAAWVQQLR
jgi:hypothetical protein